MAIVITHTCAFTCAALAVSGLAWREFTESVLKVDDETSRRFQKIANGTIYNGFMILYRPMDIAELRLVYEAGMRAFPPRKPDQPIFYPVLNQEYAAEIAEKWNAVGETQSGYVARFEIDETYASRFEPKIVGSTRHQELWVPAEELAEFNKHIEDPIEIVSAFFGNDFQGYIPEKFGLRGKDARAQFVALVKTRPYSLMDFYLEIAANNTMAFLNYAFWVATDFSAEGVDLDEKQKTLAEIQKAWARAFPNIPLPLSQ